VDHKATKYGTESGPPRRDLAISRFAARQHGIVALAQLRDLGLSATAVRSRVAAGRLHRIPRGVFAVGTPVLTTEGRWLAAVLACGPAAALSHQSAAALWGLRPTSRAVIDVTRPGRSERPRGGIHRHRARGLRPEDVTQVHGVPCTSVPRTLLDLSEQVGRRAVERALDQAEVLRILDARAVDDLLARSSGHRGAPVLRAVLAAHDPGRTVTRSELEERFLGICRRAGITQPEVNGWVDAPGGALEVDFIWRAEALIVETDGHRIHSTRSAFERDRVRDQRLVLAEWRVVRFTWRQIANDPDGVANVVRHLLDSSSETRSGVGRG
jgi:predicted transcriptional regulator of viral defense system